MNLILNAFFLSITVSLVCGGLLIYTANRWKIGVDHIEGIQKIHKRTTSRLGGVAIYAAIIVPVFVYIYFKPNPIEEGQYLKLFLFSILPVYLGGFFEDLTGNASISSRFLLSITSAVVAYLILDAVIIRTGIGWIDYLLGYRMVSLPLTVLAISAVCNGYNMIDGTHGNALGNFLAGCFTVYLVGVSAGDDLSTIISVISAGACIGILILNVPFGKIIIGESGSYTLGFIASVLSILLISRNPEISPWFALSVVAYPFLEVSYTIIRRIIKKTSVYKPDSYHLHSLMYHFLIKKVNKKYYASTMASCIIITLNGVVLSVAYAFCTNSAAIISAILVYIITYLVLHLMLFRYNQEV